MRAGDRPLKVWSRAIASGVLLSACATATQSTPRGVGELGRTDTKVGNGTSASTGACIYVYYVGMLADGREFDATRKTSASGRPQAPVVFELGTGRVMQGWEKGLLGMRVGGTRRLSVPYRMAYGAGGLPPSIPPATDLIFDIELAAVKAALPTSSNVVRAEMAKTCAAWERY